MSNVIKFPESDSYSYSQYEGKFVGLCGKFCEVDIDVEQMTEKLFSIQIGDQYVEGTRKQLSEFFWACSYFLDSDQEWAEDKYPALNK